jgi:hypothetical protein
MSRPSKALRDLLENSVVMSSTEDDVTICVTAKAYEDAYKTAYPDAANTQEAMAAGLKIRRCCVEHATEAALKIDREFALLRAKAEAADALASALRRIETGWPVMQPDEMSDIAREALDVYREQAKEVKA